MSVKVENLMKGYVIGDVLINVLRGVSFSVARGEFIAIQGPSGSGKSTLLHLIAGLDTSTSGSIYVDGRDVSKYNRTEYLRTKVGLVFQAYNLFPTLTARENLEYPMLVAGRKNIEERVDELLRLVDLTERANHRPSELSGGEQQRVAIARALANQPSIVLADEPTGNLDSKTGETVMSVLRSLSKKEGKTLILVTHDPAIADTAHRILLLKDGKVIEERERLTSGGSEL
jgi:putative ABC transport system ATP-binding protein